MLKDIKSSYFTQLVFAYIFEKQKHYKKYNFIILKKFKKKC